MTNIISAFEKLKTIIMKNNGKIEETSTTKRKAIETPQKPSKKCKKIILFLTVTESKKLLLPIYLQVQFRIQA
jgi:hypothetical protein